jgi:hypothetical protein
LSNTERLHSEGIKIVENHRETKATEKQQIVRSPSPAAGREAGDAIIR